MLWTYEEKDTCIMNEEEDTCINRSILGVVIECCGHMRRRR
jgi:hypothetical protein